MNRKMMMITPALGVAAVGLAAGSLMATRRLRGRRMGQAHGADPGTGPEAETHKEGWSSHDMYQPQSNEPPASQYAPKHPDASPHDEAGWKDESLYAPSERDKQERQ